ncbi:MAG: hypothetical protein BMS9Abin33_0877 [Gammaproteobacteria bacterium]|nr:MAG: hypothetical protein BMS9Abin33_0877 [Gammaproteobacteria bacterium]
MFSHYLLINTGLHKTSTQESGFVLFTALVFLLLLTILGISVMGTTTLESKMAFNVKDRNLAFQSSESALKAGENWLLQQTTVSPFASATTGDSDGLHKVSGAPAWRDLSWWDSTTDLVAYNNLTGGYIKSGSAYIIEYVKTVPSKGGSMTLGNEYSPSAGDTFFRITARGKGGTNFANVIVQSNYKKRF